MMMMMMMMMSRRGQTSIALSGIRTRGLCAQTIKAYASDRAATVMGYLCYGEVLFCLR
jgi:hypothetical protein